MDYSRTFAISAAGMSVERMRVDVAALNLANANTVQTADGVRYQPVRVVARPAAASDGGNPLSFAAQVDEALDGSDLSGVPLPAASVEPTASAPRMVHDPGHPLADERGFVAYPGVDPATQMVDLMSALRSYEANVAALNAAKAMALRTLELGG